MSLTASFQWQCDHKKIQVNVYSMLSKGCCPSWHGQALAHGVHAIGCSVRTMHHLSLVDGFNTLPRWPNTLSGTSHWQHVQFELLN